MYELSQLDYGRTPEELADFIRSLGSNVSPHTHWISLADTSPAQLQQALKQAIESMLESQVNRHVWLTDNTAWVLSGELYCSFCSQLQAILGIQTHPTQLAFKLPGVLAALGLITPPRAIVIAPYGADRIINAALVLEAPSQQLWREDEPRPDANSQLRRISPQLSVGYEELTQLRPDLANAQNHPQLAVLCTCSSTHPAPEDQAQADTKVHTVLAIYPEAPASESPAATRSTPK